MTNKIGTITTVDIRKVWLKEDTNFTPWLTENIRVLDKSLGIGLENARREQKAGAFRIDIVAETYEGRIAIENQYGPDRTTRTEPGCGRNEGSVPSAYRRS